MEQSDLENETEEDDRREIKGDSPGGQARTHVENEKEEEEVEVENEDVDDEDYEEYESSNFNQD